jgi:hypothetical protein
MRVTATRYRRRVFAQEFFIIVKAINPKAVDGIMHSTGSRQRRSYSFMVRAENWPWHGSIGELAI